MPNAEVFIVIVCVLIAALVAEYFSLARKKFTGQLRAQLEAKDYSGCRALLDSPAGKRFYRPKAAKLFLLDAAIQRDDPAQVRALTAELDTMRMNSADFTNYNMQKLAYGIQTKDAALAKNGWQAIHDSQLRRYVKKEADQLYDIYVLHRANHIEELEQFVEKAKNPASKAMGYYRIALQYHNQGADETCLQYIAQAKSAYADKTWHRLMSKIEAGDFSCLA